MSLVFKKILRGVEAVVTGPWTSADAHEFDRSSVGHLTLNCAHGFCEPTLELLRQVQPVGLTIVARWIDDVDALYSTAPTLQHLVASIAPGTEVDVSRLPKLEALGTSWRTVGRHIMSATELRSLVLTDYQPADLTPLLSLTSMRHLELKIARLKTLDGLGSLQALERLTIRGGGNLEDLSALARVVAVMTELELENCPRIATLEGIGRCTSLRRLTVGDCGEVDSLAPLSALQYLEYLSVWGSTRPRDNDLGPLLSLPRLKELRSANRRSYRPPLATVEAEITKRTGRASTASPTGAPEDTIIREFDLTQLTRAVDGRVCVSFSPADAALDRFTAPAGNEHTGYFWEAVVRAAIPDRVGTLEMDSEGDQLLIAGEDQAVMMQVQDTIEHFAHRPSELDRLLRENPSAFE